MKNISLLFVALICIISACDNHNELAHNHTTKVESEEEQHNENEIHIASSDATRFGITTDTINYQSFNEVIKVTGQILSSSGDEVTISSITPGIVKLSDNINSGAEVTRGATIAHISASNISGGDPNEADAATLKAAKRELDRITPLLADGIVTKREYNAALAAYEAAATAYSRRAASGTISSPISGRITDLFVKSGSFVEAGTPIATVSKNSSLTLRADLPEKYRHLLHSISGANIRGSFSNSWISLDTLGVSRTNFASGIDPTVNSGYIPVYFTFKNNGMTSAGAYVEVRLLTESYSNRMVVPISALSEQQGQYFVYARINDHGYEKRPVSIGEDDGINVVIKSGINPGDEIVVTGTTMVRLAESNGVVPEGHSHNH